MTPAIATTLGSTQSVSGTPTVMMDRRNADANDQQTVGYVLDRYQDAAKFDQPFKSMAL